ncbi:unnamed protein product [Haemonchus placei]|uniref:SIT4 phosphatase-associated family protein n=1 Tax=Haemonchus placei TaxID=6290 RepID=A0A0N4W8U2_HAEPC|nr:unnamed protein product [Haemonchus placei]
MGRLGGRWVDRRDTEYVLPRSGDIAFEQKVINSFSSILRDAMHDNLVVDWEEEESVEEDHNDPLWSPDESDDDDGPSTSRRGTSYLFGDAEVPKEKVTYN